MNEFWQGFSHVWLAPFAASAHSVGLVVGIVSMALSVALPLMIPHALAEWRVRRDQKAEAKNQ